MSSKASRTAQLQCPFCAQWFDKNAYRTHIPTCSAEGDDEEETKQCPVCNRRVKDLADHLETCDNGNLTNSSATSIPPKSNRPVPARIRTRDCPVCHEPIAEDEYDDHVDNCGIHSPTKLPPPPQKTKLCLTCAREIDASDYVEHVGQCDGTSAVKKGTKRCPKCAEMFNGNEFAEHLEECGDRPAAKPSNMKKCPTCGRMIPAAEFAEHLDGCGEEERTPRSTTKKETNRCPKCAKMFNGNEFAEHVEECDDRAAAKPSNMKKCPTCGGMIPAVEFAEHLDRCGEEERTSRSTVKKETGKCPSCFQEFPSADLLSHVNSCLDKSLGSSTSSSTKKTTPQKCFTCSATVTASTSSSHTLPCRSKHIYCIPCLQKAINEHLQANTPPLCNSALCDYELSRYDVCCLPVEEQLITRLLALVKTERRAQCPVCSFYVEMRTMRDFQTHTATCSGENIPCEYCHRLISTKEFNDHTQLCRRAQQSDRQQAFLNYLLQRTKYPITIHQVRVFLQERKKRGLSTDPYDIVNALADLDGAFPFDVPTHDCALCAESFVYDDIFVFGCKDSHKLCYGCFAESTADKMKKNEVLTCVSCNYQLSDGEIKQLRVPAEQRRRYVEYQIQRTFDSYTGGQGVLRCPNKQCKWVAELENPNERFKVKCATCRHEFCSLCSQQYHYRTQCQQLPELTQGWFFWCNTERGNYWQARAREDATFQAQLTDYQRQSAANEQRNAELRQRYNELLLDEQRKAQSCRLCPKCQRVVERIEGCNSMICGRNYHGGDQQSGCGQSFNWAQAQPYVAMANTGPRQVANNMVAPEEQKRVVHAGVQCDACHNEVQGIRFDCVHCASLIFCEKCEQRATLEHSDRVRAENKPQHTFRVITTAENANARF